MLHRVSIHDVGQLEAIGKQTYRDHFSEIWSTQGLETYLGSHFSADVLRSQLQSLSIRYYFPLHNGKISGIVKIKCNSRIPVSPFDGGFELEKIYLLNTFTGLGLGKMILTEFVKIASECGERFLWLDVLKSNVRARKLYEGVGFFVVGEIPFSTDILKIDMWVMRMDL
jgi:ribosomal protein S18 acetylase RimI-like enzyme